MTVIKENLPDGFVDMMSYGIIGYVLPLAIYLAGYHCNLKLSLPFMNIASQKNFIEVYYMGVYADPELLEWFVQEYPKHCQPKSDMGKSCIRFRKPVHIPYKLIGELAAKMTPQEWIALYERQLKK